MRARTYERDIYRKLESGESIFVRYETVRLGWCPRHKTPGGRQKQSSAFRGVNEHGWVFECRVENPPETHYFVNGLPADEAAP